MGTIAENLKKIRRALDPNVEFEDAFNEEQILKNATEAAKRRAAQRARDFRNEEGVRLQLQKKLLDEAAGIQSNG